MNFTQAMCAADILGMVCFLLPFPQLSAFCLDSENKCSFLLSQVWAVILVFIPD